MLTRNIKKYLIIFSLVLLLFGCEDHNQALTGYIEGEYTYISSNVSGALIKLNVKRGEQVKQGELLYLLDPQPQKGALEAANSRVLDLGVQLAFAAVQFQRQIALLKTHTTSQVNYDIAASAYHSRQHQFNESKFQLAEAKWAIKQKQMFSPVSGLVFDTFFRVGETVGTQQPVLAILVPANIHVLFYVPEPLLSQIKIGQPIYFSCDDCHGKTKANISYISPEAEYTPPVIYSKGTRESLVYLVRADMPADVAVKFHPGQPVDIFLHE